jgi:hypothetical protein
MMRQVLLHTAEKGVYWVEVSSLPGCISQGNMKVTEFQHAPEFIFSLLSGEVNTGHRGYVYIIGSDEDSYKIGHTFKEPQDRLKDLQTATSHQLSLLLSISVDDPRSLEDQLHHEFRERLVHGEWFALTGSDLELLWRRYDSSES